jgi:hypothetical protein
VKNQINYSLRKNNALDQHSTAEPITKVSCNDRVDGVHTFVQQTSSKLTEIPEEEVRAKTEENWFLDDMDEKHYM